jgi:hypothetical protein
MFDKLLQEYLPCTIFKLGLYRGFTLWRSLIFAPSLSRMLFAMAVPSILEAVILNVVPDKCLVAFTHAGTVYREHGADRR